MIKHMSYRENSMRGGYRSQVVAPGGGISMWTTKNKNWLRRWKEKQENFIHKASM